MIVTSDILVENYKWDTCNLMRLCSLVKVGRRTLLSRQSDSNGESLRPNFIFNPKVLQIDSQRFSSGPLLKFFVRLCCKSARAERYFFWPRAEDELRDCEVRSPLRSVTKNEESKSFQLIQPIFKTTFDRRRLNR